MFGVSPGEEIEPAAQMPAERCSVFPPDPYTSCTDFEFSSVSPDLEPVHETPDYFRINRRMFVTPRQLFPDDNEDDSDACNGCIQLKEEYEILAEVHIEVKRALEDAQQERELKSRECDAAVASLNKLQIELMQMSMRVGSLAFAMDKHKKDKRQWLRSLDTLSMKFRLLKMEHAKLSEEASQYKRSLADLTQMTNTIISTLDPHVDKLKFIEEVTEQKDIYNNLVELNGNIRVFCRCRPLNKREIDGGASLAVDFESAKDDEIFVKAPRKVFKFDGVFGPEKDQESVFEKISPLATSVLDGYNVCIFAYGQTGSGKTFTMEGTEEARGVNYRTLEELFHIIKKKQGLFRYEITMNVLEVYNEHIRDLLLPGSETGGAAKRLEVRQAAEGLHHVPGLVEAEVTNMDEAWEILQTGNKARVVGSTKANEQSSRSHCIHCVIVKGENLTNGERTRSRLWLVDLAGSERVTKMDIIGERLKEAQNINRSLSALVDVISALANKSSHIPFRNSKLTRILQDSLGGKSKTLMLVQISPTKKDVAETLCSLNFASRVRGVKLGTAKKQIDQSEIYRCKKMVGNPQLPQLDIKNKDIQLKTLEETAPSLVLKNKLEELSYKILQEKNKKLETQLIIEKKLAKQNFDTFTSKIKELERQLIIERKLARQHLYTTLTEQEQLYQKQLKQQHQEPQTPMNSVSVAQIEGSSRPSLVLISQKVAVTPASRRNSLIPVPNFREASLVPNAAIEFSPALPTPRPDTIGRKSETKSRGPAKKFTNILRRSLKKKKVRVPLPQVQGGGGGGGVKRVKKAIVRVPLPHVGVKRVLATTGGSVKKARREVVGEAGKMKRAVAGQLVVKEARRVVVGEAGKMERAVAGQQKWQLVVKERGWNHATTTKKKNAF